MERKCSTCKHFRSKQETCTQLFFQDVENEDLLFKWGHLCRSYISINSETPARPQPEADLEKLFAKMNKGD